jgi:hypothetical protein
VHRRREYFIIPRPQPEVSLYREQFSCMPSAAADYKPSQGALAIAAELPITRYQVSGNRTLAQARKREFVKTLSSRLRAANSGDGHDTTL